MKSDEIRNQPITMHGAGLDDPQSLAAGCAGILQELTAQLAELKELRKPRWVNLGMHAPLLVDASQVVGLSSGQVVGGSGYVPAVFVRLRSAVKPITIVDFDHDEVRAKLGINEDWMNPPTPYYSPSTLSISKDEWDAARKVVELARSVLSMLPDVKRSEITEAVSDFDNHQMPF